MKRPFPLAVAQLGPIHLRDSKAAVVARLIELLKEAQARHAHFVVFPELALTTFFPRYWMTDEAEIDRYFEASMPMPMCNRCLIWRANMALAFTWAMPN